jgi:hypothetical protein
MRLQERATKVYADALYDETQRESIWLIKEALA